MSLTKIAIVGGSGNLGAPILPALVKSGLNITAITRESSSSTFPEGIKVVRTAFTLEALTQAFKGQDAVISMIPITALADQGVVIDAAIAAGVKRFLPSEYGSDTSSPAVIAAVPFLEPKQKYLEYLKSKQDVISWTALATGPFFDWGLVGGFLGFDLASQTANLVDGGKTPFTTSTIPQIARSIIAVLKHADATANQLVFVESFTTTQLAVLAALEKATGGTKWTTADATSEDVLAAGYKAMGEGDLLTGGGKVITAAVLGRAALEDHTVVEGGIWNERLQLEGEDLDAVVVGVLAYVKAQAS